MLPTLAEAIAVIVLVLLPGYLALWSWNRARWSGEIPEPPGVGGAIVASLLIQVPMLPLARWAGFFPHFDQAGQHLAAVITWLAVTILVIPLGSGYLAGTLFARHGRSRSDRGQLTASPPR